MNRRRDKTIITRNNCPGQIHPRRDRVTGRTHPRQDCPAADRDEAASSRTRVLDVKSAPVDQSIAVSIATGSEDQCTTTDFGDTKAAGQGPTSVRLLPD